MAIFDQKRSSWAVYVLLLFVWWLVTALRLVDPINLPSPFAVASALANLLLL